MGNRSYGGKRIIDRNSSDYFKTANSQQLLIAQIESPEAIKNVEKLAKMKGIDGLMIGPDNLRIRTSGLQDYLSASILMR